MQWSRADFRTPVAQAVVKVTKPADHAAAQAAATDQQIDTALRGHRRHRPLAEVALMSMVRGTAYHAGCCCCGRGARNSHSRAVAVFYAIFLYALMKQIPRSPAVQAASLYAELAQHRCCAQLGSAAARSGSTL